MRWIVISKTAHDALRSRAVGTFRSDGKQLKNGYWEIPIGDDIADELSAMKFSGESWSDVVIRLCLGRSVN